MAVFVSCRIPRSAHLSERALEVLEVVGHGVGVGEALDGREALRVVRQLRHVQLLVLEQPADERLRARSVRAALHRTSCRAQPSCYCNAFLLFGGWSFDRSETFCFSFSNFAKQFE